MNLMKKLSLYIFLVLMVCGVAFAKTPSVCEFFRLSTAKCMKITAKCKHLLFKEKCYEKIKKEIGAERKEQIEKSLKESIEKMSPEEKEKIKKKLEEIAEKNKDKKQDPVVEMWHELDIDDKLEWGGDNSEGFNNFIKSGVSRKTKAEILDEYKELFFKYPLTEAYRDILLTRNHKGFKKGTKITFKDVKDFSEREFFNMPVDDFDLKNKLRSLYIEYKNILKLNKRVLKIINEKKKKKKKN